jgi:UDP-glucose 4-epimerase
MSGGLVVVTGAAGFVGAALAARFRSAGRPMLGAVRGVFAGMAPDLEPIGDLAFARDDALEDLVSGAFAVVHLAGRAHVMHESAGDAERAYHAANVETTARLARMAARAGAQRFVLASSVKAGAESSRPGRPLSPGDVPRPEDAYGRSKLAAEQALFETAAGTKMAAAALRLPLVYGRNARGNFAELVRAVRAGHRLPFASIANRRSLLYLGNLIDAFEATLDAPRMPEGVHYVADAQSVSTPDLVRAIARAWHVEPRLVAMPVPLLRMAGWALGRRAAVRRLSGTLEVDTTTFRDATGWMPRRSLDEALAEVASSDTPADAGERSI